MQNKGSCCDSRGLWDFCSQGWQRRQLPGMAPWGTSTWDPFWGCSSDFCAAAGEAPEGGRRFSLHSHCLSHALLGTKNPELWGCFLANYPRMGQHPSFPQLGWSNPGPEPGLRIRSLGLAPCWWCSVPLCRVHRGAATSITEYPAALGELGVRGFPPALMGTVQFKIKIIYCSSEDCLSCGFLHSSSSSIRRPMGYIF